MSGLPAQELLQLEDVQVGVDEHTLAMLPVYGYEPQREEFGETVDCEEDTSCQICLEKYEMGHQVMRLPCLHSFHWHCAMEWLSRSRKCPICKGDVAETLPEELMALQAKGQETMRVKTAEIQRRQNQEHEALAKRIQRSRDEALRQRDQEYRRMLQRYNNVKISLSSHHRQEARAVIAQAERRQAIQQAKNPVPGA